MGDKTLEFVLSLYPVQNDTTVGPELNNWKRARENITDDSEQTDSKNGGFKFQFWNAFLFNWGDLALSNDEDLLS